MRLAGWRILGRNVRHTGFELDVVARKGTTLAIIEVKARSKPLRYAADFANLLPPKKLAALRRGAQIVASRHPDVITVRIDLALVHPDQSGQPTIAYYVAVH